MDGDEVEAVTPEKKQRKICILGTTPSRGMAPFDDPTWEMWTIGPGGKDNNRWDRLFEVHMDWPADFATYLNDLSQVKLPQQVVSLRPMPELIMEWAQKHCPENPDGFLAEHIKGNWEANVVYPRDLIFERHSQMWFSSSISYAIAWALEDGCTDMGVYGIDLESGEEYISQFTGAKHLLDVARLANINLHIPAGCALLRDVAPYPDRWESNWALYVQDKISYLEGMLGQMRAEHNDLGMRINLAQGEVNAFLHLKRIYIEGLKDPE
jgi:hypothetical protein